MIVGMADKEVRHHVIYPQLPNRLPNCSTVLKVESVRLHSFYITLLTKCLQLYINFSTISMKKKKLEYLVKCIA